MLTISVFNKRKFSSLVLSSSQMSVLFATAVSLRHADYRKQIQPVTKWLQCAIKREFKWLNLGAFSQPGIRDYQLVGILCCQLFIFVYLRSNHLYICEKFNFTSITICIEIKYMHF